MGWLEGGWGGVGWQLAGASWTHRHAEVGFGQHQCVRGGVYPPQERVFGKGARVHHVARLRNCSVSLSSSLGRLLPARNQNLMLVSHSVENTVEATRRSRRAPLCS